MTYFITAISFAARAASAPQGETSTNHEPFEIVDGRHTRFPWRIDLIFCVNRQDAREFAPPATEAGECIHFGAGGKRNTHVAPSVPMDMFSRQNAGDDLDAQGDDKLCQMAA